jgi:hypothetical protein
MTGVRPGLAVFRDLGFHGRIKLGSRYHRRKQYRWIDSCARLRCTGGRPSLFSAVRSGGDHARRNVENHPEVGAALGALAGAISDDDMRRLNYAVDGQHRDVTAVVKEFLKQRGMIN